MPTYRDYVWLRPYFDTSFANGYCAAVIRKCAPDEVLRLLGAETLQSEAVGLAEVAEVEGELSEQTIPGPGHPVVAVTSVGGDSTLLLQLNGGSFAITEELMRPLLMGHEVVSHYRSVNADGRFRWWTDGDLIADFDPVLPELPSRLGPATAQDRVVDLIREVGGIRIDDSGQDDPAEYNSGEGAFALAERITGVEVTAALLDSAVFTVAVVDRGDKAPPTDSSVAPTDVSEWGEVARRYAAAARVSLHGIMDKIRPRGDARPMRDSNSGTNRAPASVSRMMKGRCSCRTASDRSGSAQTAFSSVEAEGTVSTSISNSFFVYIRSGRILRSRTCFRPVRKAGRWRYVAARPGSSRCRRTGRVSNPRWHSMRNRGFRCGGRTEC